MPVEELKKQLHSYIDLIDDEETLYMLNDTVAAYATGQPDIIDLLTPEQLERLDHSIQQADRGELIPHEEVMKNTREWIRNHTK